MGRIEEAEKLLTVAKDQDRRECFDNEVEMDRACIYAEIIELLAEIS